MIEFLTDVARTNGPLPGECEELYSYPMSEERITAAKLATDLGWVQKIFWWVAGGFAAVFLKFCNVVPTRQAEVAERGLGKGL